MLYFRRRTIGLKFMWSGVVGAVPPLVGVLGGLLWVLLVREFLMFWDWGSMPWQRMDVVSWESHRALQGDWGSSGFCQLTFSCEGTFLWFPGQKDVVDQRIL